jgi:hypothetical protein
VPTIAKPLFVEPLDLGTIAAGNETAGHEAVLLNRFKAIGLTWKSSGNTDVWARGEFAAEQTIDFCAIIAANALAGTKFRLRLGASQADVDGSSAPYDSGDLDFIATAPRITPDDGLYHSHLELDAPQAATWWRIDITGHTGDFEASMLVLGLKVVPSHFYNSDFEFGEQDLGDVSIGRFGVLDEQPGNVWRTLDFTLGWQSADEYEASFRPMLRRLGKRGVVYVCFDPADTQDRMAKTYMGALTKPAVAKGNKKPRTFTQEFAILSFI